MSLTRVDRTGSPAAWRVGSPGGDLHVRVTPVDAVGLEARAARFTTRSIKAGTKRAALDLAVACVDLTTLEGADTPGKVHALSRKGVRPDPNDTTVPPVAAICVYPTMVPHAVEAVAGSGVRVASVAGAFPSSLSTMDVKIADIESAVAMGADEIDIVIDRGAFLAGRHGRVFDEIARSKEACGPAHLKVILETGELGTYERVRTASMLAMAAGADFIKTSTGKVSPASTLPVALCMSEAIRDFAQQTGRPVGLKVAGGIRSAKQSWQYLVMIGETLGAGWLTPERFRIGASSLLNDLLLQRRKLASGDYADPRRLSVE